MPKDHRGIDEPKHHPGPAGDPRRKDVNTNNSREQKPARQVDLTKPPEGYAEEQPGKPASRPPSNKPHKPPRHDSQGGRHGH